MKEKSTWFQRMMTGGAKQISQRFDGWSNSLTGVGTANDKTMYGQVAPVVTLGTSLLEDMFHGDDISARVVGAIVDEACREDWTVTSDANDDSEAAELQAQANVLQADFDTLRVREKFYEAAMWGRLYGLGGILVGVDDGLKDMTKPLEIENVKNILYLTVFDKRDITAFSYYSDPLAKGFGDVAIYRYTPLGAYGGQSYDPSGQQVSSIQVHQSRLIRFGGDLTGSLERLQNQGADFSVLQKCYRAIQLANGNFEAAATLLADASQGVWKIEGLIEMISQDPMLATTRMGMSDKLRSTLRSIVIDKNEEEFERIATSFAGIPDMLDKTWQRLASAARMPLTVLMGMSPGGLNATGDSDMRWWYDTVAAFQRQGILPNLRRILEMLCHIRGYDPSRFSVDFGSLWQMSEKDEAQTQLYRSQADQIDIQEAVKLPEEVAIERAQQQNSSAINVAARKISLKAKLAVGLNAIIKKQGTLEPPEGVEPEDADEAEITEDLGQVETTVERTTQA